VSNVLLQNAFETTSRFTERLTHSQLTGRLRHSSLPTNTAFAAVPADRGQGRF